MRALWNRASIGWCRMFHPDPSWPAHGHYDCPACSRAYPVPWAEGDDFVRRQLAKSSVGNESRGFVVFAFQKDRS